MNQKVRVNYFALILVIFFIVFTALVISSDSVYLRANNNYYNSVKYNGEKYRIKTTRNIIEEDKEYKEIIIKTKEDKFILVDIFTCGFDFEDGNTFSCLKTIEIETNKKYLLDLYSKSHYEVFEIKLYFSNTDICMLDINLK